MARNAIKHGVLSREVVITAGDGRETLKEFHALAERLCNYYKPVGVVEESLVQTIATCWWRKARVLRAENGEIRRRLDTLAVDRALRNSDKANLDVALTEVELGLYSAENPADKVSTMDRWSAIQGIQTGLRSHGSSLAYLTAVLLKAKAEVLSEGGISENNRHKILGAFSFWDCVFALTCAYTGAPEAKVEGQLPNRIEDKPVGAKRPDIVALIDDRLERISEFQGYALEREKLKGDAEARSFSLPPAEATDKLLRYEAHLDRQLYRAMDQLERLQRQRKGESVPPPLNINVGSRRN